MHLVDMSGLIIETGHIVKLTTTERVGERHMGKNTFAVYEEVESEYVVKLGWFNSLHHGEIYTYYIETDQTYHITPRSIRVAA